MGKLLNSHELEFALMSEKIKAIHTIMESLCGDFQKSERHDYILESAYPFGTSMDELSSWMQHWSEDVEKREKKLPIITKESSIQIFVFENFCNWIQDKNARVYVKEIEYNRREVFFKYSTDENTTWYQGVEDGADLEDIVIGFMNEDFDNDHWNYDEAEFINWLSN